MDVTRRSHDPVDIMGKIPFLFICAFWCAPLELSPEKDRSPKKQDLCSDAVSLFFLVALVSIGNQTNMTKGLRYQDTKFHKISSQADHL